jgi:hypothetical protein
MMINETNLRQAGLAKQDLQTLVLWSGRNPAWEPENRSDRAPRHEIRAFEKRLGRLKNDWVDKGVAEVGA